MLWRISLLSQMVLLWKYYSVYLHVKWITVYTTLLKTRSSSDIYLITGRHDVSNNRSNTASCNSALNSLHIPQRHFITFNGKCFILVLFLIRTTSKSRLGDECGIFHRVNVGNCNHLNYVNTTRVREFCWIRLKRGIICWQHY